MARPISIDRNAVYDTYMSGLSFRATAKTLGISARGCARIIKELGIGRPIKQANRLKFPGCDTKWQIVRRLYAEGYSSLRIAPIVGYTAEHIAKIVRLAGISRTAREARLLQPEKTPVVRSASNGYQIINYKRKRFAVHRIIAETMLGRALKRAEVVHHKNGNIKDNRPENLEVMSISEHMYLHGKKRGGINKKK